MQSIPQTHPRGGVPLICCNDCGRPVPAPDLNQHQRCGACQVAADKPVVLCVSFTNSYDLPATGTGTPAARHATAFLRRHGITRTQVLAVTGTAYYVSSQRDPVEHLWYTLEVPASVADAIAAEGRAI